LLNFN